MIVIYFGHEDVGETCNLCDVCQKEEAPDQVSDLTQEAKDVLECITSMMVLQSRIKVTELVMTYMGSKAKEILNKNVHMIPQYGKGKASFKNSSVATWFVQFLIFQGFLKENLRSVEDKVSATFLTHGNIANLINNTTCKVEQFKYGVKALTFKALSHGAIFLATQF